ncbi:MAG: hypothetical protein MUC43_03155 [Pirellula sp.]|nr:hypothetical protein [Pirellula sp.]
MFLPNDLTLIAQPDVRNVSQQVVFKIKNLPTTCLTWFVFLFLICSLGTHAYGQHPFLGKEFVSTYKRLQAPWLQEINTSAEEACRVVSSAYNVTIWIDMDVPRDRAVVISKEIATLADMLTELSKKLDSKLVILDDLVVIAPFEKADRIASQYWRNKTSSPGNLWSKPVAAPMQWSAGADSKTIASQLSKAIKSEGEWMELVESDIWPARQFTQESLLTAATCILSSLQLELDLSAKPITIKRLADGVSSSNRVEWTYTADQLKRLGDEHCKSWKREHPEVVIETQNRTWLISATPAEHLKLVAPLIPKATYAKPNSGSSVYQGELRGTLGSVLEAVSKTMKLQFTPWPLPDAVAKREIKITYQRATMDDILAEIGKAGRVQIERSGTQCTIKILD